MALDRQTIDRWHRAATKALAADLCSDLVRRGNTVLVASATTDGKRYHVRLDGGLVGSCDCEAGLNGQPCRHRAATAIRLYERQTGTKVVAIKPAGVVAMMEYVRAS